MTSPEPMIPAAGPRLVARLHVGSSRFLRRPVVAYDAHGYALIVDMRAGRLVRAADSSIFVGLELATPRKPKPESGEETSE